MRKYYLWIASTQKNAKKLLFKFFFKISRKDFPSYDPRKKREMLDGQKKIDRSIYTSPFVDYLSLQSRQKPLKTSRKLP